MAGGDNRLDDTSPPPRPAEPIEGSDPASNEAGDRAEADQLKDARLDQRRGDAGLGGMNTTGGV